MEALGEGRTGTTLAVALGDRRFRLQYFSALACVGLSAVVLLWTFGPFMGDTARYLKLATNIAQGHGFSAADAPPYHSEIFRGPLYPVFLATLIRFDLGAHAMAVVQILVYVIAVFVVGILALRMTGSKSATVLAVAFSGYPGIVHNMTKLATEPLCALCFCAGALLFASHLVKPDCRNSMGLAACLIALFCTRAEYVVLIPVVLGWSALFAWRNAIIRYAAILCVLTIVPVAMWMVRNLEVAPGFHPLGAGSGMTLWIRSIELREPTIPLRSAWLRAPDLETIHTGSNPALIVEADDRLLSEARSVMTAHPVAYAVGGVAKLLVREWTEVYSPEIPPMLALVVTVASSSLLLMSYVGVLLMRSNALALPIFTLCVAVGAAHAFGGTEARYTSPVRPILYLFAAYSIARCAEAIAARSG